MEARRTDGRTPQRQAPRQQSLFGPDLPSTIEVAGPDVPCDVIAIEKRRDGGIRYWCRSHRADATAKGGTPAPKCRAADTVPIRAEDILTLALNKYLGGVALWGAVPAVYDTTRLPMDRGIHVHARPTPESEKEMDSTYRAVRLVGRGLPDDGAVVSEIDAIYFMVSSVFGFPMSYVTCTHCGWSHLDKDWFSVHPHRRHLCAGCGQHFHDQVTGIGNPIVGIRDACGFGEHKVAPAAKTLDIKQSEYPGGIQIWGSNPAFLWTGSKHEEEGIHVHAFAEGQTEPVLDDTFREVTIDGIPLAPVMVRVLMAQNVMPSLKDRVCSMDCPHCGQPGFDAGEAAYVPAPTHTCSECGRQFPTPGRTRNAVANPLPAILADLAMLAPRPPQQHRLDLLPETL
jgi:hypothetical protein